jgi:hypothetical protein
MMSSQVKRLLRPKPRRMPSWSMTTCGSRLRMRPDAQDGVVEHRHRQHGEQHETLVVQRQCRCIGRIVDEVHDRYTTMASANTAMLPLCSVL